jgi:hypothetical protein
LPYAWPRSGTQTIYVNPEPMPAYGGTGVIPPFVTPGQWYCPASGAYYPQVNSCRQPWMEVAPVDPMPPPQPPAPGPVPGGEPPVAPVR